MPLIQCDYCEHKYNAKDPKCPQCETPNAIFSKPERTIIIRKSSNVFPWFIFLSLIGLCFYFLPFYTAFQIKDALNNKDLEKLTKFVDFQALRQNFKDQVNVSVLENSYKPTFPI